jgi:hypothetical protein
MWELTDRLGIPRRLIAPQVADWGTHKYSRNKTRLASFLFLTLSLTNRYSRFLTWITRNPFLNLRSPNLFILLVSLLNLGTAGGGGGGGGVGGGGIRIEPRTGVLHGPSVLTSNSAWLIPTKFGTVNIHWFSCAIWVFLLIWFILKITLPTVLIEILFVSFDSYGYIRHSTVRPLGCVSFVKHNSFQQQELAYILWAFTVKKFCFLESWSSAAWVHT